MYNFISTIVRVEFEVKDASCRCLSDECIFSRVFGCVHQKVLLRIVDVSPGSRYAAPVSQGKLLRVRRHRTLFLWNVYNSI